ncbi:hypothetical protein LI103_21190 [Parabacteroides distasonis]|nr:hypothetical protein [Parabacteroides distasonis]
MAGALGIQSCIL